jgi:glycosyltransferase involved in cell wall biosynthesis
MNETEPFVSVVMPVYNCQNFIQAALESILAQRYPMLEVLVVDDGSTDASAAVAQQYSQVRLFQQANRGIAAARNMALQHARGPFVAFLDADDLWTPGKLRVQFAEFAARPEVEMVTGRTEQFVDSGCTLQLDQVAEAQDGVLAGSVLIRRPALERVGFFDEQLRLGEFIDWQSRAANAGVHSSHLPIIVLRRRIHGGNTVLRRRGERADYIQVVRAHLARKRLSECPANTCNVAQPGS